MKMKLIWRGVAEDNIRKTKELEAKMLFKVILILECGRGLWYCVYKVEQRKQFENMYDNSDQFGNQR